VQDFVRSIRLLSSMVKWKLEPKYQLAIGYGQQFG
jgi:hypothetical protein